MTPERAARYAQAHQERYGTPLTPAALRRLTGPVEAFTVAVSGPRAYASANHRGGWRVKARAAKDWRDAARLHTRSAIGPRTRPVLAAAQLDVVVVFPDHRRRDPHNTSPAIKAAIDGAVDAGVLVDDDAVHLTAVSIRGAVLPGSPPTLLMTWTESTR